MAEKLSDLQTKRPSRTSARPAGYYRDQRQALMSREAPVGNLGEQAEAAGAFRLVGGAADALNAILQRGLLGGLSDKNILKLTDRFSALSEGRRMDNKTPISERSFSASPAAKGLKENFGDTLRASTNSFFRNPQSTDWWSRATEGLRARQASGVAWSAASDTGLGATNRTGYNFRTDTGLGYVKPTGVSTDIYSGEGVPPAIPATNEQAILPVESIYSGEGETPDMLLMREQQKSEVADRIRTQQEQTTSLLYQTPDSLKTPEATADIPATAGEFPTPTNAAVSRQRKKYGLPASGLSNLAKLVIGLEEGI